MAFDMNTETVEKRRAEFANLLGTGEQLSSTHIPEMDELLAALVKEKGKAYTTLVLLLFRNKHELTLQRKEGASDEEIDAMATVMSQLVGSIAKALDFDINLVMNDVEVIEKAGVEAIKKLRESGVDVNDLVKAATAR